MIVRDGERTFNSAVLINRSGELAGRYDKIRPTEAELEKSICPGGLDPPVFQTDFGAIGIQICFDVNWRSQWRRLRERVRKSSSFLRPSPRRDRFRRWPG